MPVSRIAAMARSDAQESTAYACSTTVRLALRNTRRSM